MTHSSSTTVESAASPTATTSATARSAPTTLTAAASFAATYCSFSLLSSRFWLASKLDRDLTLKDFFARELVNCLLGFVGRLEINEGVTHRTVCARIDRDGSRFSVAIKLSAFVILFKS